MLGLDRNKVMIKIDWRMESMGLIRVEWEVSGNDGMSNSEWGPDYCASSSTSSPVFMSSFQPGLKKNWENVSAWSFIFHSTKLNVNI